MVKRAHDAGVLRADTGSQDLRILQLMLAPVIDRPATVAPELWRRYLALLLEALRATPEPVEPLPVAQPPLEQVDRMMVAVPLESPTPRWRSAGGGEVRRRRRGQRGQPLTEQLVDLRMGTHAHVARVHLDVVGVRVDAGAPVDHPVTA